MKRQKTIRFKIVTGDKRGSCSLGEHDYYYLTYPPMTEVYAKEGTLGIMCFKTYEFANRFLKKSKDDKLNFLILPINPIGRGKTTYVIGSPSSLNAFYTKDHHPTMTAPIGTICYPGVYVLK